jgi:hypothetical protein
MAIYSICDLGRSEILVMSAVLAGSGMVFSPKLAAADAAAAMPETQDIDECWLNPNSANRPGWVWERKRRATLPMWRVIIPFKLRAR